MDNSLPEMEGKERLEINPPRTCRGKKGPTYLYADAAAVIVWIVAALFADAVPVGLPA
jgi:hypothetical protein